MKTSITRGQWVLIVALALAAAPYFVRLGASSLWDANEAFYAETPREMLESNDLINPTFNYHPRLNKPPLSYWVVIPFYKLFGVSETSERIPIVLAAAIMIATAFWLGRILFSTEAGLLAAMCLAASPRFLMFSRRILIDVMLAMFMSLALLMFVLARERPAKRRVYLLMMYACIGLGVLTKGPVAAALPAAAFVVYLAISRRLDWARQMMIPAGVILIAAIVLPWYIAVAAQHGWGHVEAFVLKDNLSRYTQQVWGPRRGFFFYLPVIIGDLFPWSIFLLPLVWLAVRSLWRRKHHEDQSSSDQAARNSDSAILLGVWIAVIVVFFSISKSKEDLYILPVYPAAAALVGAFLSKSARLHSRSLIRWTALVLALLIAAAGISVIKLFGGRSPYALAGASVIGWAAIIGGGVAAVGVLIGRIGAAVLPTALAVVACNWIFVLKTLPAFESYKPVRPLSEMIASEAGPNALIGYYRAAYPSMVFYLRRPIFEYYDEAEVNKAFSSGEDVFCLMTASDYEEIRTRLTSETTVLASHPIFQVKLKGILDRVELPRVVLISNKGLTRVER